MFSMWLGLIVILLVAITSAYYIFQLKQQLLEQQQSFQTKINSLQHELAVANKAAVGVGQRLILIEKKLNQTIEKQGQLEQSNFESHSYSQAASMVDSGANVDQLVDNCGLPRAEAQLMALLKNAN